MNNNLMLLKTPYEISMEIAQKAKAKRKAFKLTQAVLAERSGVSLGSIKRFERTGEISLASLLKIAMVLDSLGDFSQLFKKPEYTSIGEIINEKANNEKYR